MNKTITINLSEDYLEMIEDITKKYKKQNLDLNTSDIIRICIREKFFKQKDS